MFVEVLLWAANSMAPLFSLKIFQIQGAYNQYITKNMS